MGKEHRDCENGNFKGEITDSHRFCKLHSSFGFMLLEPLNYMRRYYESGATQSFSFRKEQLKKLKQAIVKYEKELYAALYSDLKKSPEECWVTELGMVTAEINAALKSLHRWMKPQKAGTNLLNFPSSSYVMNEPMGVALIIGP